MVNIVPTWRRTFEESWARELAEDRRLMLMDADFYDPALEHVSRGQYASASLAAFIPSQGMLESIITPQQKLSTSYVGSHDQGWVSRLEG